MYVRKAIGVPKHDHYTKVLGNHVYLLVAILDVLTKTPKSKIHESLHYYSRGK